MITTSLQVRPAERADQQQISNLMFFAARVHRHLDWRTPIDLLGSPHYWVIEEQGRLDAVLAAPQEPPGVAWIRLFAHSSHLTGREAWAPLWEAVRGEIARTGKTLAAALPFKHWFQEILGASRFECLQNIVLLEWTLRPVEAHAIPPALTIRPLLADDLPAAAETDAASFEPLWRNSRDALQRAYAQSVYASAAQYAGRLVGYQISTKKTPGVHLARLAVRPEAQGMGVGTSLLRDLIRRAVQMNWARITVNTQADNFASLSLYHRAGFVRTGEQYPLFTYRIEGNHGSPR